MMNRLFIVVGITASILFGVNAYQVNLLKGDIFPIIFISVIFGLGVYGILKCFIYWTRAKRSDGKVISSQVSVDTRTTNRSYSRGYRFRFEIGKAVYSMPKYMFTGAKHKMGSKVKLLIISEKRKIAISKDAFFRLLIASILSIAIPLNVMLR